MSIRPAKPVDRILHADRLMRPIRVVELHSSGHGFPHLLDGLHRTKVPQLFDDGPVRYLYFSLRLGMADPARGVLDSVLRAPSV